MDKLGKFELLGELGRGGFGVVYRARDTVLDRELALKVLRPAWTDDRRAVEMFYREARAAAKLTHPNVVGIYEMGEVEGRLYIAMHLVEGESLAARLKRDGRMALDLALTIARDVAAGLAAAHERGLVHRDIKPSNILIDSSGRAIVTDFGLVRGAELATQATLNSSGAMQGTPEYVAPEIWEGQPAGPASDTYAFACVIAEMLTGRVLFGGPTPMAVMRKHAAGVVLGDELPAAARAALGAALAVDPAKRPGPLAVVERLQAATVESPATPQDADTVVGSASGVEAPEPTVTDANSGQAPFAGLGTLSPASTGAPSVVVEPERPTVTPPRPPFNDIGAVKSPPQPGFQAKKNGKAWWLALPVAGLVAGYLFLSNAGPRAVPSEPQVPTRAPTAGVSAPTLAATAAALPTATPRPTNTPGPTVVPQIIRFYSSHPLQGASKATSDGINNGYRLAMEQLARDGTVCNGAFKIQLEVLDDSTAARGAWDAATEQANATKAVADKDAMVYLGTLNSGAAKVAIPILNQAGLAMISAANANVGLTQPFDAGEPDRYYPTGKRNYMRVVMADNQQGVSGANWLKGMGAKSVYIVDDSELYGKGVADVAEKQARAIGLEIKGRLSASGSAMLGQANSIAIRIIGAKPDAVYYGGITANNGPRLLVELRKAGFKGIFLGPDGVQESEFINAAGKSVDGRFVAEGIFATISAISDADLPPSGRKFLDDYGARFGVPRDKIEVYAKYGYASMQVTLAAIGKVCKKDRGAILEAMYATRELDTVIGVFSFDKNGDPAAPAVTGYTVDASGNWKEVPVRQAP